MNITSKEYKNWTILSLNGSFTVANLMIVRSKFEEMEKKPNLKIAIDLTDVLNIDSSAIGLLTNFAKRVMKSNNFIVVFGANPDVSYIFEIVSFGHIVDVYKTREDFEKAVLLK